MPRKAHDYLETGYTALAIAFALWAAWYYNYYQPYLAPKSAERWSLPTHPTLPAFHPLYRTVQKPRATARSPTAPGTEKTPLPRPRPRQRTTTSQIYAIPAWIKALPKDEQDKVCLELNVYHEARGEPLKGQQMVAHIPGNRARAKRADWGKTVCENVFLKTWGKHKRRDGTVYYGWQCELSWVCDPRKQRSSQFLRAGLAAYPDIESVCDAELSGEYQPPPQLRLELYYYWPQQSSRRNHRYFNSLVYLDLVGHHKVFTDKEALVSLASN